MSAQSHSFSTTRDGSDEKVAITHTVEMVLRADGKPEQIYDFFEYTFPGMAGADDLRARANRASREVHITGAALESGVPLTEFIVDYFSRRLFHTIHYLPLDPNQVDPITGYKVFWTAAENRL